MKKPGADHQRLIEQLSARGTFYERLITGTGAWADAEQFTDSPALMRYAADVSQALRSEGWRPDGRPRPKSRRR